MDGITVPLALQDYMTPLFSTIGLLILTRMIMQLDQTLGRMALIGTVLTVIGGFLKATHKLILASNGTNVFWMEQSLFPFMAPGFLLFAWALFETRRIFREQPVSKNPWRVPMITIGVFAALAVLLNFIPGPPWKVPLILMATIGNVGMLVMLSVAAFGRKMYVSSALFVITLIIVLLMSQLATLENVSIGFIWFECNVQSFALETETWIGVWRHSRQTPIHVLPCAAQPRPKPLQRATLHQPCGYAAWINDYGYWWCCLGGCFSWLHAVRIRLRRNPNQL
jgi:hypothetical protein